MIQWRVLTDEEVQQRRLLQEQEDKLQAEHDAAVEACLLKSDGKHQWQMTMYHPEDDVNVDLRCTQCPVTLEDLWAGLQLPGVRGPGQRNAGGRRPCDQR